MYKIAFVVGGKVLGESWLKSDERSLSGDDWKLSKRVESFFTELPIPESAVSSESAESTLLPETIPAKNIFESLSTMKIFEPPEIDITKVASAFMPDLLVSIKNQCLDDMHRNRSKSLNDVFIPRNSCKIPPTENLTIHNVSPSCTFLPSSDSDSYVTATSRTSILLSHTATHSNAETDSVKTSLEKLETIETFPEDAQEPNPCSLSSWETFDLT